MFLCSSAKDGTVEWKVVQKREIDEKKYNEEYCAVLKDVAVVGEKGNYSDIFWYLWPGTLNDAVSAINAAIVKENNFCKSRYQRRPCIIDWCFCSYGAG